MLRPASRIRITGWINAFIPIRCFKTITSRASIATKWSRISPPRRPTVEDALALVDRASWPSAPALLGRAYIDIGGNHPDGDRLLEAAGPAARWALGFGA